MNRLLLASASQSRQRLLQEAQIPFDIILHGADEEAVGRSDSFDQVLMAIARAKMEHAQVPGGAATGQHMFVLTADSMCRDSNGIVHGKPVDRADAIRKIKALSGNGSVGTAFCLAKKEWRATHWHTVERIERVVSAEYVLEIPDDSLYQYLEQNPNYLSYSGGLTIEGFCAQFVRTITGSYTTILGLPMFEVREALREIGFF